MHTVVVLALQGAIPFDLAIPFQVFGDAATAIGEPLYQVSLAARRRGPLTTSEGFSIIVPRGLSALAPADTIVVIGSEPPGAGTDDDVLSALRRAKRRGVRLLSICTGAFVLAEAGLLDGRKATTHWRYCEDFGRRYPRVSLDRAVLFVEEGELMTSAGAAAGIDLCLHVVARDYGADVANRAARRTVSAPHRSGGQAQFIETPLPTVPERGLDACRQWALEHLAERITLSRLARQAVMSPRTFLRHFKAETGTTPQQWLIEQRVSLARRLLEQTDLPIDEVARRSGFGSAQTLRLHFRKVLKLSPTVYRGGFRHRIFSTQKH
jgi:transcriptional regulator GlxA family with amidase domain